MSRRFRPPCIDYVCCRSRRLDRLGRRNVIRVVAVSVRVEEHIGRRFDEILLALIPAPQRMQHGEADQLLSFIRRQRPV